MKYAEGVLTVPLSEVAGSSKLYEQSWLPDGDTRAALLIVHGYGEHSGRYSHVAKYFVERGYAVYAIDHDGHGKSDGSAGFVEHFSVYLDGVQALLAKIQVDQSGLPIFLVGHSMGGLISSSFLIENQDAFAGCVLSGPAVKSDIEPPGWQLAIIRVLAKITPKLGVLGLDASGVSRDQKVVDDYIADPLVFKGKISARLVAELFAAMQYVMNNAPAITLPIILMHGEADVLAAPIGSRVLHEKISSSDNTLKLYPRLYHEIFNEPEQLEVLGDMHTWLEAHLPA